MRTALDYPSQRGGRNLGPPEPTLLDSCIVQHLAFVFELADREWTPSAVAAVRHRCSPALAGEILALGDILFSLQEADPPIWAVTETSRIELERAQPGKRCRLTRWWRDLADSWEACISEWPEHLKVFEEPVPDSISVDQLSFPFDPPSPTPEAPYAPPFGPFPDPGDRALIRDALTRGFPAILTSDLRTLWRFRSCLYPLGIEIWRPSDWWQALGGEPGDLLAA